MKLSILTKFFVAVIWCCNSSAAVAGRLQLGLQDTVTIAEAFSNNMVLQREKPVPIWGKAVAGHSVTVHFAGQLKTAVADSTGKWQVILSPLQMSATPQSLTVQSGTTITLNNILVGDVWLCSGQSNMEYPLDRKLKKYTAPKKGIDEAEQELTKPKPDGVRYLYVERNLNKIPVLPTKGWTDGNDTLVRYISAIGYFFAKDVYEKTKVPIGIISSSWGGTRIEQWQPDWSYAQSEFFKDSASAPNFKIDGVHPGQMYKGLIAPLVPFAIKGVLWYQGESNAIVEDQLTYPYKFDLLVNTWRNIFQDDQLPFYYVQIAPYLYSARKDPLKHSTTLLPEFWEAQAKCLDIKNTGMVVTTDLVDELGNIHPSYKWTVGRRLALWALEKDYHIEQAVVSGPIYKTGKRKKHTFIIQFTQTGSGLKSSDGNQLTWFSVAGNDGKFVPATAIINGDKIVVSSQQIKKPRYVRFAWDEKAQPNLVNSEGLPAVPFRTDEFNEKYFLTK